MLTLTNIVKGFGTPGTHDYHKVLDGLSLEINKGNTVAITGPSGSGKSTLFNIIGSLDKADGGELMFNGTDIAKYTAKEAEQFRNKHLGFVFQLHHLLPQCTVLENILIPTLPNKQAGNSLERAEAMIKDLGLWERRNDKPNTLSGGECQRTAVIRALINEPSLILADEPTGALDEDNALALMDLLLDIRRIKNTTLLVITHSDEIANRMDKVFQLRKGKLIQIK